MRLFLTGVLLAAGVTTMPWSTVANAESRFVAPVEMVLARWQVVAYRAGDSMSCSRTGGSCLPARTRGHLAALRGLGRIDQVTIVNDLVNRARYAPDMETYGVPDHWASPGQFMERGSGDSEDFAIAKYFMLRELGVEAENLRLVIVHHESMPEACFMQLHVNVDGTDHVLTHRGAGRRVESGALPHNALFQIRHTGVVSAKLSSAESISGVW